MYWHQLTVRKEIEQNECPETNVVNRIEIETGKKQQVAAIRRNCIVGHENKNQTQDSSQTQGSGKGPVLIKSLYFRWNSFKIIYLFKIFRHVIINRGLLLKGVIISLFSLE